MQKRLEEYSRSDKKSAGTWTVVEERSQAVLHGTRSLPTRCFSAGPEKNQYSSIAVKASWNCQSMSQPCAHSLLPLSVPHFHIIKKTKTKPTFLVHKDTMKSKFIWQKSVLHHIYLPFRKYYFVKATKLPLSSESGAREEWMITNTDLF